jgi:molybdopterin converting factor small subunit
MKVRVFPGPFCSADALDEDGFLYLDAGSTLSDVYKKLKYPVPLRGLGLCMVNYEKSKMNKVLNDGDTISFFTPLSGG